MGMLLITPHSYRNKSTNASSGRFLSRRVYDVCWYKPSGSQFADKSVDEVKAAGMI
jgi:hypothetical protein